MFFQSLRDFLATGFKVYILPKLLRKTWAIGQDMQLSVETVYVFHCIIKEAHDSTKKVNKK